MVHLVPCPLLLLNLADVATKPTRFIFNLYPVYWKILVGKQGISRALVKYLSSLVSSQTSYVFDHPVVMFLPSWIGIPFIICSYVSPPAGLPFLRFWHISLIRPLMPIFFSCMCLFPISICVHVSPPIYNQHLLTPQPLPRFTSLHWP